MATPVIPAKPAKPAPQKATAAQSKTPSAEKATRATQKNRLIQITTSVPEFGEDILLVSTLSGEESLSGLFHFKLEVLFDTTPPLPVQLPLPVEKLLGKPVSVSLHNIIDNKDTGVERYFHAIVSRVLEVRKDKRYLHFAIEVVPWLWLLTQKTNSRVFQNKNVPDIIETVVNELKADYGDAVKGGVDKSRLTGTYTSFDHCIQYNETDFHFLSRLMEEEGIFYFFEHDKDTHTLVLADHNKLCKPCSGNSAIRYRPEVPKAETGESILDVRKQVALLSGKYAARDHHFQLTGKSLQVEQSQKDADPNKTSVPLEIYEYPGGYAKRFNLPEERLDEVRKEGDKLAEVRIEEEELPRKILAGHSNCRNLIDGRSFSMTGHPDSDGSYILTSVKCSIAQSPDYISNQTSGSPYQNDFISVPAEVPIRPLRITPKPLISGPQTAVVSVKEGEESWIDKFGRVRIQFPWERRGKNNETSTCWVRVAQPWAGAGWGAHFWPRVGQEVVVEFLEGDPDRPIITGSVYNSQNSPPYVLPANYTRSGIISRSSKDGGNKNFNEIRFEDKKGHEQIFLNAERDMDHRVENEQRIFVGASQHLAVGGPQNVSIGGDHSSEVTGNHMEKIGAKFSLVVGASQHQTVGNVYTLQAGDEVHLKSGAKIVIEGGSQVSIKGPGGFVDISSSGVTIQGNVVNINSGGSAASGTDASPDPPNKPALADDGSKGGSLA